MFAKVMSLCEPSKIKFLIFIFVRALAKMQKSHMDEWVKQILDILNMLANRVYADTRPGQAVFSTVVKCVLCMCFFVLTLTSF